MTRVQAKRRRFWTAWVLLGLGYLAAVGLATGAWAQSSGGQIYWECKVTNASGVVVVGSCPEGTAYPMPVTVTNPAGTPDNVNISQVNGVTVLTGAGATGPGSQRVTTAQDATTVAGAAPGTAGVPSPNVVTVQGITSGTPTTVAGTVTATQGTSPWVSSETTPITNSAVTPTVQATTYAAGVTIGGLISFTAPASTALVQSVSTTFLAGVLPSLDVVLFNANPTGSTVTDRTALAVAAADNGKVIGVIHVNDCVLLGTSSPSVCQAQAQSFPFKLASGTTLYAAVVVRGATITLGATNDMIATLNFVQ